MSAVVVDEKRRITIESFDKPLEIKQADGQVVGRFVPEAEYRRMLNSSKAVECPFSDEELEHSFAQRGGSSLKEFWKQVGRT